MEEIKLSDPSAERAVLSGVFNFGNDAYFDVSDIITEKTFTVDSNAVIYKCLKHLLESDVKSIDIPSIWSAASELGLSHFFDNRDEVKHLTAVTKFPVDVSISLLSVTPI